MAFNSLQFLLIFLPLVYGGFLLVHRGLGWAGVYPYLAIASLVFYAQFSVTLMFVLAGSILANYAAGQMIVGFEDRKRARLLSIGAVLLNLLALGYFKYMNFFIDIGNSVGDTGFDHLDIILPIGISFYTFTQIGYLIEASAGSARKVSLAKYAIFAGFFPCVTAGPLLLQREIFDQMEGREDPPFSTNRVAIGLTMFTIGLAKKVIIADSIAPYSNGVFDGAAAGAYISTGTAWIGSLAYTFQLYFDFSGYTDMAIGLAFLFGFRLPVNFNAPFKTTSISDFWNRWHMTMTRFFTTFVYTHLAMRSLRRAQQHGYGPFRKWLTSAAVPVFFTFLVAGIWHGAGWTFVAFGLTHGFALAVNHGWRECKLPPPPPLFGWALTMLVVVVGLIFFRAESLDAAFVMLSSMWGVSSMTATAAEFSVIVDRSMAISYIVIASVIVLLAPSSQQIMRHQWLNCDHKPVDRTGERKLVDWIPNAAWATATGVLLVIAITSIGDGSKFLYYNF